MRIRMSFFRITAKQDRLMEVPKKKTDKKGLAAAEKTIKTQDRLPKTSWQINQEDTGKSRWNPSALYF